MEIGCVDGRQNFCGQRDRWLDWYFSAREEGVLGAAKGFAQGTIGLATKYPQVCLNSLRFLFKVTDFEVELGSRY